MGFKNDGSALLKEGPLKQQVRRFFDAYLHHMPSPLRRVIVRHFRRHERSTLDVWEEFIVRCRKLSSPRVLELGTKRSCRDRSTKHTEWVPRASVYVGSDLTPGVDVDVVADVHQLSTIVGIESFDVILSCSTFEHFKYPHLAAHEIMKCLAMGGLLFIQTHQTYPIHSYPQDYFRFSREALASLFGTQMGFNVIATDYEYLAAIESPENKKLRVEAAYLNVRLLGEKTDRTPDEYVYELTYE